jgi:hypothetical protein
LVGEARIALIHKRVTEMGYLFHPRRVDHGIDGHIDLVDPGTYEVLNLVLLIQSKASGLPFPYETETSFQYTCDEADLNYRLSGNAPVVLILSHPEREQAWWVDIKPSLRIQRGAPPAPWWWTNIVKPSTPRLHRRCSAAPCPRTLACTLPRHPSGRP